MSMSNKLLIAVLAAALVMPSLSMAGETKSAGIITSTGISATMPTREIVPGGDMWVGWVMLPPGRRVEFPQLVSQWTDLELVLGGSAIGGSNAPPGKCFAFRTGIVQDVFGGEGTSNPGDGVACGYAPGAQYWEENRGTEPFTKAVMNIGGPNTPGELHTTPGYVEVGGFVQGYLIPRKDYALVENELIAAGAMTVSIRQGTLPPHARLAVKDRYPTVRFVIDDRVSLGSLPAEADPMTAPKSPLTAAWIPWVPRRQLVITNTQETPVQFVEWSVVPEPGVLP